MPVRFIIALFLIVVAVVASIIASRLKARAAKSETVDDEEYAAIASGSRWIIVGAAAIFLISSLFTMVGTRRIGVVTEFGRPVDSLSNGLHLKLPWQQVHELDGSIQTDSYVGGGDSGECVDIRIGNESKACVDVTVRWRIVTAEADQLYRDFRSMDNIRESLVTRELNASLNAVLGDFNPLDAVNLDDQGSLASLDELADQVDESVRGRVEGRVEVLSVTIPLIRYDAGTQDRLDAYQAEIANTRVAEQRLQTAEATNRANSALAESVSNDPNVLVARCFEILDNMVDAQQPIPAGFSCWPGGSTGIVIPASNNG